ncbi:MAG: glycosyltransferase family 9 protein [Elusimicrobiota bacterium]|nr:glycosyltransferase family 9 protein [Elusimicrobiota bacterium]
MKILLISLKGLGDTVYMIPLIRRLREKYGGTPMTLVVRDKKCVELFANCPYIRPVLIDYKKTNAASLYGHLKTVLALRREKFDVSLTSFPSNRLAYNLFAFFSGAKRRITHYYDFARWRTLPFLQDCRVNSDRRKHQVEKNLDLLSCLGLDPAAGAPDMSLWLSAPDEEYAQAFLRDNGIDARTDLVIGVHPSISKAQVYKNWAPGNINVFAELIDWLAAEYKAKVLVFSGPDEKEAADSIIALAKSGPVPVARAETNKIAAMLKNCRLFINTDGGLGPLAAAAGTTTITVLGPTSPAVTAPYGRNNTAITLGLPCAPCYMYPYESTAPAIKCEAPACMGIIDINKLKKSVGDHLRPEKG